MPAMTFLLYLGSQDFPLTNSVSLQTATSKLGEEGHILWSGHKVCPVDSIWWHSAWTFAWIFSPKVWWWFAYVMIHIIYYISIYFCEYLICIYIYTVCSKIRLHDLEKIWTDTPYLRFGLPMALSFSLERHGFIADVVPTGSHRPGCLPIADLRDIYLSRGKACVMFVRKEWF